MNSNKKQRLIGLFLFLMGSAFFAWSWYMPFHEGKYSLKMAGFGPMFTVIGAVFLFLPIDEEKLRESGGPPYQLSQYPILYKILLGVAIASGFANMAAMHIYFSN